MDEGAVRSDPDHQIATRTQGVGGRHEIVARGKAPVAARDGR